MWVLSGRREDKRHQEGTLKSLSSKSGLLSTFGGIIIPFNFYLYTFVFKYRPKTDGVGLGVGFLTPVRGGGWGGSRGGRGTPPYSGYVYLAPHRPYSGGSPRSEKGVRGLIRNETGVDLRTLVLLQTVSPLRAPPTHTCPSCVLRNIRVDPARRPSSTTV